MKINTMLLLKYLRCATSPDEERFVREWLANDVDGSHARKYKEAHLIFEGITLYGLIPSERREAAGRSDFRPSFMRRVAGYAAAAAVAVFAAVGTGVIVKNNTLDAIAQKTESVYVPAGKTMELTLEDGSRLWLNSGTEIEYPAVFARKSRNVKLIKGEALFDVVHDEDRPFTVSTFASDVRVLGTRFDVQAEEERGFFQTSLLKGMVRVSSKFNVDDNVILHPDQSVTMNNGRLQVSSMTDASSVICWKDGLVNLTGLPFDQLMKKFENVYNVQIHIERQDMPEIRYSRGKVRVSDGIDHALEMLSKASDFKWIHDKNSNIVVIR